MNWEKQTKKIQTENVHIATRNVTCENRSAIYTLDSYNKKNFNFLKKSNTMCTMQYAQVFTNVRNGIRLYIEWCGSIKLRRK